VTSNQPLACLKPLHPAEIYMEPLGKDQLLVLPTCGAVGETAAPRISHVGHLCHDKGSAVLTECST
jgi:hypothetical protein